MLQNPSKVTAYSEDEAESSEDAPETSEDEGKLRIFRNAFNANEQSDYLRSKTLRGKRFLGNSKIENLTDSGSSTKQNLENSFRIDKGKNFTKKLSKCEDNIADVSRQKNGSCSDTTLRRETELKKTEDFVQGEDSDLSTSKATQNEAKLSTTLKEGEHFDNSGSVKGAQLDVGQNFPTSNEQYHSTSETAPLKKAELSSRFQGRTSLKVVLKMKQKRLNTAVSFNEVNYEKVFTHCSNKYQH